MDPPRISYLYESACHRTGVMGQTTSGKRGTPLFRSDLNWGPSARQADVITARPRVHEYIE